MADQAPASRGGFRGGFGSRGSRGQVCFIFCCDFFHLKKNELKLMVFFHFPLNRVAEMLADVAVVHAVDVDVERKIKKNGFQ